MARWGPELYYLFAGAREQLLASLQHRAEAGAEMAIIDLVYKNWGWKKEPGVAANHLCQRLGADYQPAEISDAGKRLRAENIIKFSGELNAENNTLVAASYSSPDSGAGEDFLFLADQRPDEQRRSSMACYGPEGVLRQWGRVWQSAALAREQCRNLIQQSLVERLMFRALSHWSGPVDIDQLLLGQIIPKDRRQGLIAELQYLVGCQAIVARRQPSAPGIVTMYSLNLFAEQAASHSAGKLSPGQLQALADNQISLARHFTTAGRLYQAQLIAQRQASNKLQRQLIAAIAKHQLENPGAGIRLSGISVEQLINAPEFKDYSSEAIQAAAQQLQARDVIRAIYRHGHNCYCLPLPVFNHRYWRQRQPDRLQAAQAIASYGLQNYYFQSARLLESLAADSDQQSGLGERLKALLATRALLPGNQRWFSQQEIVNQLPNIYADQRQIDSLLQQLRQRGLVERRVHGGKNYYAAIISD